MREKLKHHDIPKSTGCESSLQLVGLKVSKEACRESQGQGREQCLVRCKLRKQSAKEKTSRKTINWIISITGQYILKVMECFIEMVKFELKKTMRGASSNRLMSQQCYIDQK